MTDPVLHLAAGPNGAGKTTLFREVIEPATSLAWVNADDIAAESTRRPRTTRAGSPPTVEPTSSPVAARSRPRRCSPTRRRSSWSARRHGTGTSSRSTWSSSPRSWPWPASATASNTAATTSPRKKIRARYRRLWAHIAEAITLTQETFVYDNTKAAQPFRLVARFERGRLAGEADWPPWTPPELQALASDD